MSRSLPAILAALALTALATTARAEDMSAEALLEAKAPAIVSAKILLRWGEREMNHEARATAVDPSGLLLLSNEDLGTGDKVKVAQIKVTFGADPKEWEAVVVARDRVLHLAFLQVLGLEKPVPAIDLAAGAEPVLAQDLRSVWRDSRGFDFAPALRRHYVSGRIDKPRRMWSLAGDGLVAGLPVFDAAGRPVGVAVNQESSEGAEEEAETRTLLLPLSDATRSLEQAKKRVPEAVQRAKEEKAAEAPAEKPAEKPADGAGMADAPPAPAPENPK